MGVLSRHYLHTLGTNFILKFVVGLIIAVITARALGPEGRGEYNLLVLIILTMTALLNLGIPAANTFFVAQKRYAVSHLITSSTLFALVLGCVSFGLLYAAYHWGLAGYVFPTDKLTSAMVASFVIMPIVFFNLFAQGILLGENKIKQNNYVLLLSQGFLAFSLTVLYFLNRLDVEYAITLFAASHLVSFFILLIIIARSLRTEKVTSLGLKDYRSIGAFSLTIHLGNLAQFSNYRLDAFFINYFLGTTAVGLYILASNLGEILWLLSASMASVLLPTIAAQHLQSKEIAVKASFAALLLSLIGGLFGYTFGPWLITTLFGNEFADSVGPFFLLLPGIILFSLNNVLATYMTGMGHPGLNTWIAFVSLFLTITLDIILIPTHGIKGAAIASSVSYGLSAVLSMVAFRHLTKLSISDTGKILRTMTTDVANGATRFKQRFIQQSFQVPQ